MYRDISLTALLCLLIVSDSPARDVRYHITEFDPTMSELREAMGLDIYSFRIMVEKFDKFKISLREFAKQDAEPIILFQETFIVADTPRDNAVHLVFSFLKPDNTIGSALQSNLAQMNVKVSAIGCSPKTVTKSAIVPMAKEIKKVVRGSTEGVFLRIVKDKEGGEASDYPRADLVIERIK
jgi:hypothetical protein